jgi:flavin reductase (DIM6/NTAB) family NADH-FMN oxidoreductase RutF
LENLIDQGCFTINAVDKAMFEQAHQCAARYPREQSEFLAVGFDEEYSDKLSAPYVAQSPIKSGMKLVETHTLAANDTVLVVGEIVELRFTEDLLASDGQLNINAAQIVAISGLDEYHLAQSLGRMPYPKAPPASS